MVKKEKEISIGELMKKIDKGYYYVAGIILVIALLFIAGFFYMQKQNTFVYNNIEFNKSYYGKIVFYTANVPALDSYKNVVGYRQIDFRNDPREIGSMEVKTTNNKVEFLVNRSIYVSYGEVEPCEDNMLAAINFYAFLEAFGLKPIGGLNNKEEAKAQNLTYVNCTTHPNNTVIFVEKGDFTSITQVSKNCYEIKTSNCEILKAFERFELAILEDYLSRFTEI